MRTPVLVALEIVTSALIVVSLSGLGPVWLPSTGLLAGALFGLMALGAVLDATAQDGLRAGSRAFLRRHWFALSLGAISLAALGVRLMGLDIGLGHLGVDIDERRLATSVMAFFQTGELNHLTSEDHPGLHFWFLAGSSLATYLWALTSGRITGIDQASVELFVLAGRAANAVLGAATVLLTGLLGRSVAGSAAGLVAALLVATAPLAVATSTILRNDVGLTFFVLACACVAQRALASERRLPSFVAGALSGCATATKATGVFTLLPAGLAALRGARGREAWTRLGLGLVGFVLAVAVTNHFVWSDFPNFVRQVTMDFGHVREGHFAATSNPRLAYVSTLASDGVGWPLLAMAGVVVAVALARGGARESVLWSFPLVYLWFMTGKQALFPRWAYPLLPFAAVGGAQAFVFVVRSLGRLPVRWARPLAASVALALLAPALWPGLVEISRRFTTPTYALAESWLAARRAPGDRVLTAPNMLVGLKAEALGGRRRSALKEVLDQGGRYQLYAYDWIVVPETLFEHARLSELRLANAAYAERRFLGTQGADIRIYAPPAFGPVAVERLELSSAAASDFLGFEWKSDGREPGLPLPAEGGSVYLPMKLPDAARLTLEVAAAESPLALTIEGAAIPLTAEARPGGRTLFRSEALGPLLRGRARNGRVLVVRLEAPQPVRVVALSILR